MLSLDDADLREINDLSRALVAAHKQQEAIQRGGSTALMRALLMFDGEEVLELESGIKALLAARITKIGKRLTELGIEFQLPYVMRLEKLKTEAAARNAIDPDAVSVIREV